MKTIGLIGGMSWESSIEYYRIINQEVRKKLGGTHSAKSVMISVDFAEIEKLQHEGRWEEATGMLVSTAKNLESAGADFVVLCTNTMHKMADAIMQNTHIPFLHIADATAEKVKGAGISKIGLLGTRFTMEEDFYKKRLIDNYGLSVLVPDEIDRNTIHHVIYDELVKGSVLRESKNEFITIIAKLIANGAQGIILGCTEIGLLVTQKDCPVRVFDTTRIHAEAAVDFALH
jgi:aspartate racemase